MTTLTDAAAFATDETVKPVLIATLERTAFGILAEDDTIPNHWQRVNLARRVVFGPNEPTLITMFMWALSTNDSLVDVHVGGDAGELADALPDAIDAVWETLAQ